MGVINKIGQSIGLVKTHKEIAEKEKEDRDKKCEPIASQIIQIIAKHNPSVDEMNFEERVKLHGPIQREINQMMKDNGFTVSESSYVWKIVINTIDSIRGLCNESIQRSFDFAESKLWEEQDVNNITLQKIDNVLQLK
jgi:hypothetical protein